MTAPKPRTLSILLGCAAAAGRNALTPTAETSLADLGCDSLDSVNFIMLAEEALDLEHSNDDEAPELSAPLSEWATFFDDLKGGAA